jgi:hypothetical protein
MAATPQQRRANLRLALVLASLALAFAVGFVVRLSYFGGG